MTTLDIFKRELNLLTVEMQRCNNSRIKNQILSDILLIQSAVIDILKTAERAIHKKV
ncbi:hypothetical protein [Cytobacillus firmus]|uniref:hypothetical protein n=1 Tax=Cytobacillus firmus TaxID=1399 RepID=UPI001C98CB67|nr:hypothetical protein [Cytobacillus firmus]MBY6052226.1 hypothetical protein [Cytobacillus firmus]